MKVLFVTWELPPFFHVGGLGDISRSLPKALLALGVDIRIVIPQYQSIMFKPQERKRIGEIIVEYGEEKQRVNINTVLSEYNIPVYFLQNNSYLNLPQADTFPFFNLAIVKLLEENKLSWQPDVIHCNDLHAGLLPLLVKHKNLPYKTLFTIHNLTHQGKISVEIAEKLGIESKCRVVRWEIKKKQINTLLEAVVHADQVNTVSPTYAKEILTEEFGAGLDDILRQEETKITGIINGVDYDIRELSNAKHLFCQYNIDTAARGKWENKRFLQEKLGFEVNDNIPLVGFVGRFSSKQKGVELMHKMLRRISLEKYQFVFLGKGEEEWEERYLWLNKFFPQHVFCKFDFDDKFAAQIYSASDFFLIPSRYEPCGLIQMIAMRYGALPVARATGGLKDTIRDGVDGYLFKNYSSLDLEKRLKYAISIWKDRKSVHAAMVQAAMKKDFSWDKSAGEYIKLYEKVMGVDENNR